MFNHISVRSKLTWNKYKIRHDWKGKMVHCELCQGLKFGQAHKWYMHKQESVLENEMQKILWDFEIQINNPILVRRPDLEIINKWKKKCHQVDFAPLLTAHSFW